MPEIYYFNKTIWLRCAHPTTSVRAENIFTNYATIWRCESCCWIYVYCKAIKTNFLVFLDAVNRKRMYKMFEACLIAACLTSMHSVIRRSWTHYVWKCWSIWRKIELLRCCFVHAVPTMVRRVSNVIDSNRN